MNEEILAQLIQAAMGILTAGAVAFLVGRLESIPQWVIPAFIVPFVGGLGQSLLWITTNLELSPVVAALATGFATWVHEFLTKIRERDAIKRTFGSQAIPTVRTFEQKLRRAA